LIFGVELEREGEDKKFVHNKLFQYSNLKCAIKGSQLVGKPSDEHCIDLGMGRTGQG
jgi:hypothetical protein